MEYPNLCTFRRDFDQFLLIFMHKSMKKTLFLVGLALQACTILAQSNQPYSFTDQKRAAATPVKSQDQTGTCWAFSTASFLESEAQRLGKGEHNFSEMFVVRHIYRMKCENYVRRQGKAQFGEGGLAHDLLNAVKKYGIMPESNYPGRKDPSKPYNHGEFEKKLRAKCEEFAQKGQKGELAPDWTKEIDAMLDEEFGTVPLQFTYNNGLFTPISFRDFIGIQVNDYVTVTSFNHHPFWETFILEIPDNWANGTYYNMPLTDMMRCLNNALITGHSVEWDADVSNRGFSGNEGIAIVPATDWKNKDAAAQANTFKMREPEKTISQELRQELFDKQVTMDDHLMHITGLLQEKQGTSFYAVKNSWGEISPYKGYVNCSEAYMRLNTISFTLHKNALPEDVRSKLGLDKVETPKTETRSKLEKGRDLKTPVLKQVPAQKAPKQPTQKYDKSSDQ
jgi:bleomycin hydrolase